MKIGNYDTDFYQWTVDQSEYLKLGKLQQLDLENLAEEIRSLGKQQQQELENRLAVLIAHLLKWKLQPELRSKSWRATINEQRRAINRLIVKNPSLKSYMREALQEGYALALDILVRETPFDYSDLPKECELTEAEIFNNSDDG